jgi:hypothetical protein
MIACWQAVPRACKFYETWDLDMKRYARYLSNMISVPFFVFVFLGDQASLSVQNCCI